MSMYDGIRPDQEILDAFNRALTTVSQLKCLRCSYEWLPRILTQPKLCPSCKARHWNKPATAVLGRPAAQDGVSSSGASADGA